MNPDMYSSRDRLFLLYVQLVDKSDEMKDVAKAFARAKEQYDYFEKAAAACMQEHYG